MIKHLEDFCEIQSKNLERIFPKRILGITVRRPGVLSLSHSHPLFPFKISVVMSESELPMANSYFALSRADRNAGATLSRQNPDLPIMITAVVPSGFKYSALFLGGIDITERIEKYIQ